VRINVGQHPDRLIEPLSAPRTVRRLANRARFSM
jgi:hypothetical protein